MTFQAPFPYFGGKSPVAPVVWQAFGDVPNYVEPFFGSGAVLLARPATHPWRNRTETVNDLDGMVANYWRATQAAPDDVARWADWPVNENDLHARHVWLVARKPELQARLEGEPDWYDAKVAGWWLWGMCQFIGSGWCSGEGPWQSVDGQLVRIGNDNDGIRRQRPHLGDGRGINRKRPHLGNDGRGINRKRPHLADDGMGINRQMVGYGDVSHTEVWSEHLRQMMRRLSDRLRRVRVCCGDWTRVCGPSPTVKNGVTGVFLDPPYSLDERSSGLYNYENDVADAVRTWALEHGDDPLMRIVLCGYDGEHAMPASWRTYRWKTQGGYANEGEGRENATRETLWLSASCLQPDQQAALPLVEPA